MSTLSELIPSGGTQNNIEFVAQGTLANGQTVVLRSDGKVEAVAGQSGSVGTKVVFEAATSTEMAGTYDSANNKVVLIYQDHGNSYYGTAIVGTVSGTAITFGSAVVFNSGSALQMDITFDSNVNKVVIGFRDGSNSNAGTGIVGTVSGTSISFGSEYVFSTPCQYVAVTFDSNSNKVVFGYRHHTTDHAMAIVGTVSGTAISYGSEATFNAVSSSFNAATFDSNSNKVVMFCQQATDGAGKAAVGTVSGTSISFGTAVTYASSVGTSATYRPTFDSNSNKVVIGYSDSGNSNYGTAIVGTVSGTSISFGTPVVFDGANNALYVATVFDSVSNKIVISYRDDSVSNSGTVITGTVSGTSISFSGQQVYNSSSTEIAAVFDVNANATVSAYYDGTNSNYGTASVTTTAFSNATSFVGITNAAISSGATGEVAVKGGLSTTAEVQSSPPVLGAQSTITTNGYYITSAYDSTTKNTVFSYYDASNSGYGTARVASISGTTLTYGSSVVYNSAPSDWGVVAYDSNTNRIVIAYRGAPAYYVYAVVGTVSGTSISFGTPVAIENVNGTSMAISFDSSANKVVIAYRDNNGAGKVVVGTPSGTSISFGSIVQFAASVAAASISLAYDSTNNKTVLVYGNAGSSANPTAVVGTVSGTSISFGSAVVINGSASVAYMSLTFDPSSGKVVVSYDQAGQSYVGTVSGTSISFGSAVTYNGGASATYNYLTVDTVTNNVVLFYEDNATNGAYVYGTISGTSISWSTPAAINSVRVSYGGISFNVDSKLTIMGYRQDSPQGGFVTPLSLSTISEPFTIGSNYFVQDDGTLATTSSTTKAGKAISTTALNLVDPT